MAGERAFELDCTRVRTTEAAYEASSVSISKEPPGDNTREHWAMKSALTWASGEGEAGGGGCHGGVR